MIATEIVDHILSFLRSDHTTLETCSTVFPQLVDRHLYSHITLRSPAAEDHTDEDDYYPVDPMKFLGLFFERPQVVLCVSGVRVIITVMPPSLQNVTLDVLPVISSILTILSKVQSIELRAEGKLSWDALSSEFCTTFQKCLRLYPIKEAMISNINAFPLDSFDDSKHLKKLFLSGQFTGGEGVSTPSYPRLSSLRVESQPAESQLASDLIKMVSWTKSNSLHTLTLCMHQHMDLPNFKPLIQACSTTLVNLELDHDDFFRHHLADSDWLAANDFGNTQFPSLKHMILRSHIISIAPRAHLSSLPYVTPLLTALSRTSAPHSVSLSVHLQFRVLPVIVRGGSDIQWPDITVLGEFSVFRHPIELHFPLARFGYFLKRSPDIQKLVQDGKLIMLEDQEY